MDHTNDARENAIRAADEAAGKLETTLRELQLRDLSTQDLYELRAVLELVTMELEKSERNS